MANTQTQTNNTTQFPSAAVALSNPNYVPAKHIHPNSPTVQTLPSRAMLFWLKTGTPPLGKTDKNASAKLAQDYGNQRDMAHAFKRLYPKEALETLFKIRSEAKAFNYTHTLPWLDKGGRILPSANYLAHSVRMREFKIEWEHAKADFVRDYAKYVAEAKRLLGGLFDPNNYPSAQSIGNYFEFDYRYTQIPEGKDFRVDMDQEAIDAIAAQINVSNAVAVQQAMKDPYERIAKVTKKMVEGLKNYQPGGVDEHGNKRKASGAFHPTLVTNISELCDVLPTLNIAQDPELDALTHQLRVQLTSFSAEELKSNEDTRSDVAESAQRILDNVSQMFA